MTKKPKVKIKISDIVVQKRTLEDLYKLGYVQKREKDNFDVSAVLNYYFKKIPKELKVQDTIEKGTRLWYAKDFYNGKKKKICYFVKIKQPTTRDLKPIIIAKTDDNYIQEGFFDSFCLIPEKHKASKIKQVTELHEEYKEKKNIIRNEIKKQKEEKENKEKELLKPSKPIKKFKKTTSTKSSKRIVKRKR